MTVSELTARIRSVLEPHFEHIEVEGEVSNLHYANSGHIYFTLKDEAAIIQAVFFKNQQGATRVKGLLSEGMQLRVTGRITIYSKRGGYQIICTTITEIGNGAILAILEKRKQKLAAEGLFDAQHKKPIPRFVRSVAIITSPHGAAVRDFLETTRRRNNSIDILVVPCLVQGDGAAIQICERLAYINHHRLAEVIVMTRGGGSIEDLLPFSDEQVVRAVFASHIPVIAAIGHEVDIALCELAADLRASTPSTAAEMISIEKSVLCQKIYEKKIYLQNTLVEKIRYLRQTLTHYRPERLRQMIVSALNNWNLIVDGHEHRLQSRLRELLTHKRNRMQSYIEQLHLLSPLTILKRGFAIVQDAEGAVVTDSSTQRVGDTLHIRVNKGDIATKVTGVYPSKEGNSE